MRLAWIMFSLAASTSCLALAGLAEARPSPDEALERADLNGDGAITRGEFREHRNIQFARFDRNNDGYLSGADLPRRARRSGEGRLGSVLADFDHDRDGRLSHGEFVDGPSRMFDRADVDRDNQVDARELRDFQVTLAMPR